MKKFMTILIAFALPALVFEIGVRTFDSIAAGEIGVERRLRFDQLEHIKAALQVRLNSPEACTQILNSLSAQPGEEVPVRSGLEGLLDDSGILKEVVTESARIAVEEQAQMVMRKPDEGRELRRYSAVLRLSVNVNLTEHEQESRQISIPFLLWVNDENQVDTCFGSHSLASLCNAAGGYYRPGGDGQCKKTVSLNKWARDRWEARGECHFGGVVSNPNQCGTHQARKLEPIPIQQEYIYPNAYVCLMCE